MIVRPCNAVDLDALMALARKAERGLTTIPRTEEAMAERIEASVQSFHRPTDALTAETYMLVLEEDDGTLSGLAAIYTNLGYSQPFYSYRLSRHAAYAPEIDVRTEATVLSLVNDFHGYAELGTLFLDPARRGGGRGTLLSFSRFMLIASARDRFGENLMAEMRGWSDDDGRSPFWEAVGRKFFHLDFKDADVLSGVSNRFIADLMPKVPIYTSLLPDEAQAVIGKTHDGTIPARRLLEKQGFRFQRQVDVFDGGPCLEARAGEIPVISDTQRIPASEVDGTQAAPRLVAAGDGQDLRIAVHRGDTDTLLRTLGIAGADTILASTL
jgi:arginine N-succinyltransferase